MFDFLRFAGPTLGLFLSFRFCLYLPMTKCNLANNFYDQTTRKTAQAQEHKNQEKTILVFKMIFVL